MKKKHFHDEYEISKLGDVVLIAPYRSGILQWDGPLRMIANGPRVKP